MSFFSLSTSTKIYGIFNPNFWGINSIRHTVTPRLSYNPFPSYSYNADGMIFPLMNWNYELENETRNKNMPISLGNIFEAKLEKDSDAEADSVSSQPSQDFRKVELFRLDFSSSYDFDNEEKPFGNLSSTFRTKPFRNLSIDVSTTHDVYDWDLLRLNVSTGFSISGNLGEVDTLYTRGEREERDQHELGLAGRTLEEDTYFERGEWDLTRGVGTRRWSLSMDYHYNRGENPESAVSNINISAKIQPTQNWSLSYRAYYDVDENEITRQSYNITRNLHCWEGSLNWQRYGDYWNYYVIFRIKELPDIKVEHRERSTP
jgi:lipopolysaccharide assembly outer membrane protein LptD (OstA)